MIQVRKVTVDVILEIGLRVSFAKIEETNGTGRTKVLTVVFFYVFLSRVYWKEVLADFAVASIFN